MPTVEFPRMGTIAQAAAESGVPAYRVRQLCKTGQVRSVQCGRKILVNLSSLAAWMNGGRHSSPASTGWSYDNEKAAPVLEHRKRQRREQCSA